MFSACLNVFFFFFAAAVVVSEVFDAGICRIFWTYLHKEKKTFPESYLGVEISRRKRNRWTTVKTV